MVKDLRGDLLLTFFKYDSPYRTGLFIDLNVVERYLPLLILLLLTILIFRYKDYFKNSPQLDKKIRYFTASIFGIVYLSHYLLRFSIYGFDTLILPFQLCSISMFLAIVLLVNKNKTIFSFVLYTGILGGLLSLTIPIIGYNSAYYRYYQYEIAHTLLVLTPLYFVAVHDYLPTKQETIKAFLIFQGIVLFMVIFNYYANTDFMFVFIDKTKITKFPVIAKFGGIPLYLLWGELLSGGLYFVEYQIITFLYKYKK